MKQGLKYWLSWIGVIPIAIIAGIIVTFPVHWILYGTLSGGESPLITPYPELPEKILSPFFTALTFVWVGSIIAPSHKLISAIILAIIWVFFAGFSFAMGYFGIHLGKIQYTLIGGGLPLIMGVIGAVAGVFQVRRNGEEKEKVLKKEPVEIPINPYKEDLVNLFFIGVFVICLYNIIIRYIFFVIFLCVNVFLIIYSWKEKLYTTAIMKINIAKNYFMSIILLVGLLKSTFGYYATIICLGLQIVDFLRHFISTHLIRKSNTNV